MGPIRLSAVAPGLPLGGRGAVWMMRLATAALANDELHRQNDVQIGLAGADLRVQDVEGRRAKLLHGLADGGERRVQVARDGHVVEAGDGYLVGYANAAASERVHHAERCLVVRADDRSGQLAAGVEQRGDDLGAAGGAVVALPLGT